MLIFGPILVVALLLGLLWLLLTIYLSLVSTLFWVIVLLAGAWVVVNLLALRELKRRGEGHPLTAAVYAAWNGFFTYTAYAQGLIFMVLFFWSGAVLFSDTPGPESVAVFAVDFLVGSSALAVLVFVLGVSLMVAADSDLAWWRRWLALPFALAVGAFAATPWLFRDWYESFADRSATGLFWVVVAVYCMFSAVAMLLAHGPQDVRR